MSEAEPLTCFDCDHYVLVYKLRYVYVCELTGRRRTPTMAACSLFVAWIKASGPFEIDRRRKPKGKT